MDGLHNESWLSVLSHENGVFLDDLEQLAIRERTEFGDGPLHGTVLPEIADEVHMK
jgi:hypothetical protein